MVGSEVGRINRTISGNDGLNAGFLKLGEFSEVIENSPLEAFIICTTGGFASCQYGLMNIQFIILTKFLSFIL
jgi:hypothetical protein